MAEQAEFKELAESIKKENTLADPRLKLTKEMKGIQEDSVDLLYKQNITLKSMDDVLVSIGESLGTNLSEMTSVLEKNRQQEMEDKKEDEKRNQRLIDALSGVDRSIRSGDNYFKDLLESISNFLEPIVQAFRIFVAIPIAGIAFATSFYQGFIESLNSMASLANSLRVVVVSSLSRVRSFLSFFGTQFLTLFPQVEVYFDSIRIGVVDRIRSIKMMLSSAFAPIVDYFRNLRAGLATRASAIGTFISNAFKPVREIFTSITNVIKSVLAPIGSLISTMSAGVSNFASRISTVILNVGKVLGIFDELGKLKGIALKVANTAAIAGRFLGRVVPIVTVIMGVFSSVKGFLAGWEGDTTLTGRIKGALIGLWDTFIGSLISLVGSVFDSILSFLGLDVLGEAIKKAFDRISSGVTNLIEGVIDIISGIFTLDFSKIIDGVVNIGEGIFDLIMAPVGAIMGFLDQIKVFDFIIGAVKMLFAPFRALGMTIVDIFEIIMDGAKMLLRPFRAIGKAIMRVVDFLSPVIDPILNLFDVIADAVSGIGDWVSDKVDRFLGWIPGIGGGDDEEPEEQPRQTREQIEENLRLIEARQGLESGALQVGYRMEEGRVTDVRHMGGVLEDTTLPEEVQAKATFAALRRQGFEVMDESMRQAYRDDLERQRLENLRQLERLDSRDQLEESISGMVNAPLDFFNNAKDWVTSRVNFSNIVGDMSVSDIVSSPLRFFESASGWVGSTIASYTATGDTEQLTGIIYDLVTSPYDTVMNASTSLLDKLGFENAAEYLEGLSVSDILMGIVNSVWGIFGKATDWVRDKFSGFSVSDTIGSAVDATEGFFQSAIDAVLPERPEEEEYSRWDPRRYIAAATPDWLYDFAEGGEDMPEAATAGAGPTITSLSDGTPTPTAMGLYAESEALAENTAMMQAAQASAMMNGGGNRPSVNNTSVMQTNNSTTHLHPRPPAMEQPDNASDTLMSMGGWGP